MKLPLGENGARPPTEQQLEGMARYQLLNRIGEGAFGKVCSVSPVSVYVTVRTCMSHPVRMWHTRATVPRALVCGARR